jgi:hypothetical protein
MFTKRIASLALPAPLLAVLCLPAGGRPPAEVPAGKWYALLVGVQSYEHAKLPDLKYTENDIEELARVLAARPGGFTNVTILTSSRGKAKAGNRPTTANLRAALRELLAKKTKHDTVLIALAGHGVQLTVPDPRDKTKTKDEAFFCPADAQPADPTSLIGLGKLFNDLDDSGAGVKLLLVDACRNDPKEGRNVDVDNVPRPPHGTAALFSCASGQRAFETAKLGKGHGVFFHYVLEGLRGKAKNEDGEVNWDDLTAYVKRQVPRAVPKIIGEGAQQSPHLVANLVNTPVLIQVGGKPGEPEDAEGQNSLGVMYRDGQGVARDDKLAVQWFRKAAEKGHARAQSNLGWCYEYGRGVAKDEKEAVRWYRKAAEKGAAIAQSNLAGCYEDGRGVAKDEKEAVRWYRKAADQGDAHSQNGLGLMYGEGRGVARDDKEAVAWYRKAAEKGHAFAQLNLGDMYLEGRGVPQDDKLAAQWYRKAAEQDDAVGQDY